MKQRFFSQRVFSQRFFSLFVAFFNSTELRCVLWSFRREFVFAMGVTALVNVLMLAPTIYMLQVFDRVMVSYSAYTLYAVTLVLFFFLAMMSFSEWVRSRLLVRLGVRLDMALNPRVFGAAFERREQGEDSAHLFDDLARVRQFLTGAGLFAMLDVPWTPIYIAVLFLLHPSLGGLAIVFCLALGVVAWLSGQVMKEPLETVGRAKRDEGSQLETRLEHGASLEAMGMMGGVHRRWLSRHVVSILQGRRALDAQMRVQAFTGFVRLMQQSLTLAAGALLAIDGEISAGAMVAAGALMSRATYPLDAMIRTWKDVVAARKAFLSLERVFTEYPVCAGATVKSDAPGAAVRFVHVSASASGSAARSRPILNDVSFTLSAGTSLGIKGASGSGKSTLARALLGIWPHTQGDVLIDGVPIRQSDRAALGYLPQDVELFEGTVAENVARFGKIDPERVIEACQMAGVHSMILHFPEGYDTQIGVGGAFLSGGQRQRIGLARALYGNPRLVVLDEPNANLDEAGDRALAQAVKAMKDRGTTLVLISHRPQIMAAMDLVLVMEEGRVRSLTTAKGPGRETAKTTADERTAYGGMGGMTASRIPAN
ncbi:MAG: type I secretion system permease/ATPase [Azoarcus sp.]|jgi:ATP-binding cassette subfamily C exporter for protease/lipase|nr:type I secretion system permease/ATPase [Azoarcus sp.]